MSICSHSSTSVLLFSLSCRLIFSNPQAPVKQLTEPQSCKLCRSNVGATFRRGRLQSKAYGSRILNCSPCVVDSLAVVVGCCVVGCVVVVGTVVVVAVVAAAVNVNLQLQQT